MFAHNIREPVQRLFKIIGSQLATLRRKADVGAHMIEPGAAEGVVIENAVSFSGSVKFGSR